MQIQTDSIEQNRAAGAYLAVPATGEIGRFHFSTATVPAHIALSRLFNEAVLQSNLGDRLDLLAELVINVYHHAVDADNAPVSWSVSTASSPGAFELEVSDGGCGIQVSLARRGSALCEEAAIARAVGGRYSNGRGCGLSSIKAYAIQGLVDLFEVRSGSTVYSFDGFRESKKALGRRIEGTVVRVRIRHRAVA